MRFQLERIALFSDAVFAIAITLMMIEIKPPHLHFGAGLSEDLWALGEKLPMFAGTILSFFLIGMFWRRHHQLMKYMTGYDQKVIGLNLTLLLSIAFIPFSTAFVFENVMSGSPVPLIFYNLNYILATFLNYRLFAYILGTGSAFSEGDYTAELRRFRGETWFQMGVFAFVILLAFWNAGLAPIAYALLGLENLLLPKKNAPGPDVEANELAA